MKAVFIHDHNFVYDSKSNSYLDGSGGAFDSLLWSRYLDVFDELTVIGRLVKKLPNRLINSSCDRVNFNLIEGADNVRNLIKNFKQIKSNIKNIINGQNLAIIRLPSTLGFIAVDLCIENNIKYVIEIVGDPFEANWYHGNILGKIAAPLYSIKMRKVVSKAPYAIYVTKEHLQKKYPNKNKSISISNVRLLSLINKNEVIKFYSTLRKTFVIGMIGSFHVRYKGHHEAFRALNKLKLNGFKDFEFQIVGSGDSKWLNDLIKKYNLEDNVKIIGTLKADNEGIIPFLDNLDVLIHPSLTEGLPRVVIEAMSRGRICLTSSAGGTSELIDATYLHRPGDWKKLADDILNILQLQKSNRIEIGLKNLNQSFMYQEHILQNKRVDFLKYIIQQQ